jgi:hypothetical protein
MGPVVGPHARTRLWTWTWTWTWTGTWTWTWTWTVDALVGRRSGSNPAVQIVARAARELVMHAVALVAVPVGLLVGRTHDDPPASISWMANPWGPASSRT